MSEQPLTYDWVAGKPKAVPADKLPPKEYMKGNLHIVDLSKCVDPYTESRRCNHRPPPLHPVALQHRW